jgi:transposase
VVFGPAGEPLRVLVRPGATDMRKQINGLAVIVEQQLEANPFEDRALYLFCRERRILKALDWDATGFCLWQKRLEKHRFPWPQTPEKVKQITREQLSTLLVSIDFWQAHSRLSYRQVS